MCELLISLGKQKEYGLSELVLFKSNVLRKITSFSLLKTKTAVCVEKQRETYVYLILELKNNINKRNNLPQPCKTPMYTLGPSNLPWGSTLGW